MFEGTVENIASVLAMIVGVSLALSTALGPLVTYLVEAIKGTGLVKDGYSGLVAIGVGMVLGIGLTSLTDLMASEPYSLGVMILLGAFVGAIVGAGGISQYKASGSINMGPALAAGANAVERDPEVEEAVQFFKDVKVQAAIEQQRLELQQQAQAQQPDQRNQRAPAPR